MLAANKTALGRPLCSVCLRAPVTTEDIAKVNERAKVRVCDDLGCRDIATVAELDKHIANGTLSAEQWGPR